MLSKIGITAYLSECPVHWHAAGTHVCFAGNAEEVEAVQWPHKITSGHDFLCNVKRKLGQDMSDDGIVGLVHLLFLLD